MTWQFPDMLRPFLGKLTWRKKSSSKAVYLTFDDGPVPEATPMVLDILEKYNCVATFFCVGENVTKYPEIYADILKKGHKTGNHSYNHLKGWNYSVQEYTTNVQLAAQYIDSRLFRPPYGRIKRKQQKALTKDYEIIMWDVLTYDYDPKVNEDAVFQNVKKHVRNGSIIVFHDSVKSIEKLINALPRTISYLQSEGYEFRTL